MKKTISAIVVTYNRLSLLKSCLHFLLNQELSLDNIFVVNNASTDGTKSYLNNLNDPKIKPLNMNKNLGGAGGFSFGTQEAYENSNSNYFWLMDDDTMPSKSASKILYKSAKMLNDNFGFLSSNVRWWKDNRPVNVPVTTQDWSKLINKSLIKIKEATFVSFFTSRKVITKLGLPISEAFIWGDDTEYSDRLSTKYPCYFVPDSIVFHKSNEIDYNENIFNETYNRISFYKCYYRNHLYIDRKYYSKSRLIKNIIEIIFTIFKMPFKAKNYRLLRTYYTVSGLICGLFFNPKIRFPN